MILKPEHERARASFERLAEVARAGDKAARQMLNEMGIEWRRPPGRQAKPPPITTEPGPFLDAHIVSEPSTHAQILAIREAYMRPLDTLLPVRRPEDRFALGWARSLFLACLAGLAFRYFAYCYATGLAFFRGH